MRLLTDAEIKSKIDNLATPLITKLAPVSKMDTTHWQLKNSQIQPCSFDLHIGRIQIPSENEREPVQEFSKSGYTHLLKTGQTAVITTLEALHLPGDMAGIGFPPSAVSIKGLLMTNPGHVDPGYDGPMHFTVINMARNAYPLNIDDRICTLLFFELDSKVAADYGSRRQGTPYSSGVSMGLQNGDVNILTRDFVDVEKRAKKISRAGVRRASIFAGLITAGISAVGIVASQFVPYYLGGIEEAKKNYALQAKDIETLKTTISELQKKLESMQVQVTTKTVNRPLGPGK